MERHRLFSKAFTGLMKAWRRTVRAIPRGSARIALIAVAAGSLFLAVSTLDRSARTARVNGELAQLHATTAETASEAPAETAAPAAAPARKISQAGLSRMGFPDGSAIPEAAPGRNPGTAGQAVSFHRTGQDGTGLEEMQELKRINRDTVGWLQIENVLDLPVVYRDNSWYLNHDFRGQPNAAGTLFLDQYHPLKSGTQNLLIHGHNMKDGSMFAMLTHYTSETFLKAHPLITFSTLWEKETYQVFAVLKVSSRTDDPGYFNFFSSPSFASETEWTDYIARLKRLAVQQTDLRADPEKALLTLSTCVGDDRVVVVAQRIL